MSKGRSNISKTTEKTVVLIPIRDVFVFFLVFTNSILFTSDKESSDDFSDVESESELYDFL